MAIWESDSIVLTNNGQGILSKVQMGIGSLQITKIVTSSGRVPKANLKSLTAVTTLKQEMSVVNVDSSNSGSSILVSVNNEDLAEAYYIEQIGIYAYHVDYGETLYMIAQCKDGTADMMPLPDTPVALTYSFYLLHSEGLTVNITIDPSGSVPYSVYNQHLNDSSNPHGVTKAQVGLGNVENKTIENQTPVYDEASLAPLTSGEKLSIAFGKLKKAVSSLIDHIGNTNNPHSVTLAQTGYSANSDSSVIQRDGTQSAGSGTAFALANHVHPIDTSRAAVSHTHSATSITTGTLAVARGGTGQTTLKGAANSFIQSLDTSSSTPVDADYYISQYASGGTDHPEFYRRPVSSLWTYIKGKTDALYSLLGHNHDDRYYTESEIDTKLSGKAASSHTHSAATTSANGFMSSADKTKLDGIATGATKVIVDSALSDTSTNALQNKVIYTALSGKSDTGHAHSNATTSASGFMSSSDKTKLDGVATGANNYSLPTASSSTLGGVKIGSNINISDGVINVPVFGVNTPGLVPAADQDDIELATNYFLREDGVWTSTPYPGVYHGRGSNGLVPSAPANDTSYYLNALGEWSTPPNTTYSVFGKSGSTAAVGLVPKPSTTAGSTKYLREDGTWVTPPNTTYSVATTSANGLMSSTDKSKLDGIATGANNYTHPTHTAKSSGLYKITVDSLGHVSAATAVVKSDITALGIPSTNTTYSAATTSAAGLMSAADKTKLNRIQRGSCTATMSGVTNTLTTAMADTNYAVVCTPTGLSSDKADLYEGVMWFVYDKTKTSFKIKASSMVDLSYIVIP